MTMIDTTIDGSTTAAFRAPRGPKPLAEMTPGERERADAMDVRCLDLCIGMLERVNGVSNPVFSSYQPTDLTLPQTFEENSTLEGILGELIVPAVKRKELVLREKGLVCLGLVLPHRAAHGAQFVPAVPESDTNCAGGTQAARAASRI
jgi:condensin complex subunit 3